MLDPGLADVAPEIAEAEELWSQYPTTRRTIRFTAIFADSLLLGPGLLAGLTSKLEEEIPNKCTFLAN
jgi:hypothetical protein